METEVLEAEKAEVVVQNPSEKEPEEEGKDQELDQKEEEPGEEKAEPEDEDGEVVVTFGDEDPSEEEKVEAAPSWVKEVRKQNRELAKEIKKLKQEKEALTQSVEKVPTDPGKKPTLEDSDYDSEEYEKKLDDWYAAKKESEAYAQKQEQKKQAEEQAWQQTLNAYSESKEKLNAPDYDEAEETVSNALNVTQQGMILQGAENPALVVLALGSNPKKLKELGEVKDPVKFAVTLGRLEAQMKVKKKRADTSPEPVVSSSGGTKVSGSAVDSTLERLREKAAKTGDYSEVNAYRRQLRARGN